MNQITEQILQAVDTIITEKLDTLKFDTTETCTIIGQESKALNTYRVKYNNVAFVAKALNGVTYQSDDVVSVTIPKGDLNAPDKVIVGKIDGRSTTEYVWENPLDRMIDYVQLQNINRLQYTVNSDSIDYPIDQYNIDTQTLTPDADIWEQFIDISALGVFDFIGFKADIYTYLGIIPEEVLPMNNERYWIEIQLCDASGKSLHNLVGDQVSSLIFTSEDIDGDPYSQPFENNTYQKLWHFPKDEIQDPTQIRQIKVKLGVNPNITIASPQDKDDDYVYENEEIKEGDEVVQILQNRLGIYVENIELSFGYDLDNYVDEGIILAIPKEHQSLQQGYSNVDSPPDITAWVVREDNKGLLRDDDFAPTLYLENTLALIENDFINILPRYASYNIKDTYSDQRGWFIEGSDSNIQLRERWLEEGAIQRNGWGPETFWSLSKLSDENDSLKALINQIFAEEDYNITDEDVMQQVNDQFSAMEHYVSQIIEDYYPHVEYENDTISNASRLLTESETEQIIKSFFVAYENLIDIILKAVKKDYQLRWYQYEFGATNDRTDAIGGGYWIPFGEGTIGSDFDYYLGTKLLGNQYEFSINAETQIKAILCQEGYKTEIINLPEGAEPAEQYQIYQSTNQGQTKIYEKIIKFTNAHFTESALVQNNTNYLTITGRSYLNIYNYNNVLYTADINANYNELAVSFKDETALADMKLQPGKSVVKWTILNPRANQIEGFDAPTIDDGCLQWWKDIGIIDTTVNDFTEGVYTTEGVNSWINSFEMEIDPTTNYIISLDENFTEKLNELQSHIQALRFSEEMRFIDDDDNSLTPSWDCLKRLGEKYSEISSALTKINSKTVDQIYETIEHGLSDIWLIFQKMAQIIKNNNNRTTTSSISYLYDGSADYKSTVTYKPREKFDPANNQSIVRCAIGNFSVDFPINFSLIGSQGTDYILTIEPVVETGQAYKGLKHVKNAKQQYKAILRNSQGITLDNLDKYNLTWGWKQQETFPKIYRFEKADGTPATQFSECVAKTVTWLDYKYIADYAFPSEEDKIKECYWYDNPTVTGNTPIAFIENSDVISQETMEGNIVQLTLNALCLPNYLTKRTSVNNQAIKNTYYEEHNRQSEQKDLVNSPVFITSEEEYYYAQTTPQVNEETGNITNGIIRCRSVNYKPNSHILQVECTVPVVYEGQENAEQTRTLVAYYPIAIYDDPEPTAEPPICFESADGIYFLGWNELNEIDTPKRKPSTAEPNKYDILGSTPYRVIAGGKELTKDGDNLQWQLTFSGQEPKVGSQSYFNVSPSQYLRLRNDFPELGLISSKMIATGTIEDKIIYQCPIQCSINHYSIDVANTWSGTGVYVDEKKGVILTTQLGAGKKDINGLFTGVMMGEVSYNLGTELENGLFGYKQSEEYFRLTTAGDFQVKQNANNYIKFIDGNFSLQSNNCRLGTDTNYLAATSAGIDIVTNKLAFNSTYNPEDIVHKDSETGEYFSIEIDNSNMLLEARAVQHQSNESGAVRSRSAIKFMLATTPEQAITYLNWNDGTGLSEQTDGKKYYIYASSGGTSPTFSIDEDGAVTMSGHIVASSGEIAGWQIDRNVMKAAGLTLDAANSKISLNNNIFLDAFNSKISVSNMVLDAANQTISLNDNMVLDAANQTISIGPDGNNLTLSWGAIEWHYSNKYWGFFLGDDGDYIYLQFGRRNNLGDVHSKHVTVAKLAK